MELTVRHLSGSRSGQTQKITSHSATLGRNPSNQIAFDPEADRAVSGTHAEFQYRNGAWWIKDLGSSNGTWIEGQRVSDHMLKPGDVVQLGVNGPRLQVDYYSAVPPAGVPDMPLAAGAPEGRTVVMMMGGGAPAAGGAAVAGAAPMAGYAPTAPPKKKGGILKVLLILFLLFGLLIVAAIGGAVVLRNRNKAKKPQLTPAQVQAQKAAEAIKTQIEQTKATMAQAQASLQKVQSTTTTATTTALSPEAEDLKRQLQDQQRMIEELTRQLQEQNDQSRPPAPPAPATRSSAQNQRQTPPAATSTSSERMKISNEQGIAEFERRAAEQQKQQQQPAQQAKVMPTPAKVASAAPPAAQVDLSPLPVTKVLKKRVSVKASPNEIPLPGLPGGASRDVAKLIVTALTSAGDYVALDRGADAAISVEVTNFKDDKKTTVDTRRVTQTAGAFGSLAGVDVPDSPVNVKSGSRDSEIQIYVRAFDRSSSQIAETQAIAASKASKTQFKVESVSLGQEALAGDNPLADVTRKVAADAIDAIRADLDQIPWTATVSDQKKDGAIIIDCGGPCGVEVGDVFDIYDGGRGVARVRINFIDAKQSTAEIISGEPAGKYKGKVARYAGRETESPVTANQSKPKFLQFRQNSKVYDGPGRSFREVRELKAGTRVRYLYTVGPWAKATDGRSTFWVPMAVAQITT